MLIVRYVTMAGDEGLWAIKLDPPDGKSNAWNRSAMKALLAAEKEQGRGRRRKPVGASVHEATASTPTPFRRRRSRSTPPQISSRTFDEMINSAFPAEQVVLNGDHEIWIVLAQGSARSEHRPGDCPRRDYFMSTVCHRFVSWDSEFDAKKGQGERPGHPVCICAVEIDSYGRVIEHRLKAPYPATPPWDHGPADPYVAIVYAGSAEAGSCMNVGWPFPPLIIDLYAEYMVIHNTEMVRKAGRDRGEQTARSRSDPGVQALRREGDGRGPQG